MSIKRNYFLGLQSRLNDRTHPKGCMMLSTSRSLLLTQCTGPCYVPDTVYSMCCEYSRRDGGFSPLKGEEQFLQSVRPRKVVEKSGRVKRGSREGTVERGGEWSGKGSL